MWAVCQEKLRFYYNVLYCSNLRFYTVGIKSKVKPVGIAYQWPNTSQITVDLLLLVTRPRIVLILE